jgi:phosphatidylglycerophosphate synthase
MEIRKEDVLTPANLITVAGLALSIHGATHINEVSGVIEYGVGRVFDMADGYVARRTHASRLGEMLDAVSDKAAIAFVLFEAWHQDVGPEAVLAIVALYNVVNAVANTYAEKHEANPKTNKAGKFAMFGQNAALGSLLLSDTLGGNVGLEAAGWVAFSASLPLATKASYEYVQHAWQIRNQKLPRSNIAPPKKERLYQRRRR